MSNSDLKSLEHSIDRIRSVEKLLEQILYSQGRCEKLLESMGSALGRVADSNDRVAQMMQQSWEAYSKQEEKPR